MGTNCQYCGKEDLEHSYMDTARGVGCFACKDCFDKRAIPIKGKVRLFSCGKCEAGSCYGWKELLGHSHGKSHYWEIEMEVD